jgi:glycogen debranching enzyme
MTILAGIFDASLSMDLQRLPELFCGFERHLGSSPIQYPVACAPQSWAAASIYLLLQGCIGLSIDARKKQLRLANPALPPFLDQVNINNLRIGSDCAIDILLKRHGQDVAVSVVRKEGLAEVIIIK